MGGGGMHYSLWWNGIFVCEFGFCSTSSLPADFNIDNGDGGGKEAGILLAEQWHASVPGPMSVTQAEHAV